MFTIIRQYALGKGGVKWNASTPAATPAAAPITIDPLEKAKQLLKAIRESRIFKNDELDQLKKLMQDAGKAEDEKNKALVEELHKELAKPIRTQQEWNDLDYTNPTE